MAVERPFFITSMIPEAYGDGRPEGAVVRVAVVEVLLGDGRHRVAIDVGARRGPTRPAVFECSREFRHIDITSNALADRQVRQGRAGRIFWATLYQGWQRQRLRS